MSSLFGVELPTPVNFVIAFVFVLLLIGAAAGWFAGSARRGSSRRARPPAAARGGRFRRRGRPPQARHHPPRQRRASVDDRRPERRRGGNQYGPRNGRCDPRRACARTAGPETMTRTTPPADPTPWPLQPEPAVQQSVRNARAAADSLGDPRGPATAAATPVPDVRPCTPPTPLRASPRDRPSRRRNHHHPRRRGAERAGGQGARFSSRAPRRRHGPPQPPSRRQIRPPIRASPRWRSVSKRPFVGRWRSRSSPRPSASPPPSMSKP